MADLLEYFGLENGYELRWVHSVNSRYLLRRAIEDSAIHMIEVDVTLGRDGVTPICAHPPDTTSDLTLVEMVDTVWRILTCSKGTAVNRKGIKLDFQSTNAVFIGSTLLAHYLRPTTTDSEGNTVVETPYWPPLVLNADILPGPGLSNSPKTDQPPVDWHEILEASKRLPFASCSLGWTTAVSTPPLSGAALNRKRPHDDDSKSVVYTDENVKEMGEIAKNFTCPVTVVFRACYVFNHKDVENWWGNVVLTTFLGKKPVVLDEDGDVASRTKQEANQEKETGSDLTTKTVSSVEAPKQPNNLSFLFWSHGRDEVDMEGLQQLALRMLTVKLSDDKSKDSETASKVCLLLDLHQKHAGMLDSWELAAVEGVGKETMPSLIKEYVAQKYPNNARFRYT